ncbi:hypothetical protein QBC43DRAFT_302563 [Cladorrhinum sp. PSN259]|nr:hypothetical protein QBC43DRAFT_302563 [Cladorrhinum sp. PSN259]
MDNPYYGFGHSQLNMEIIFLARGSRTRAVGKPDSFDKLIQLASDTFDIDNVVLNIDHLLPDGQINYAELDRSAYYLVRNQTHIRCAGSPKSTKTASTAVPSYGDILPASTVAGPTTTCAKPGLPSYLGHPSVPGYYASWYGNYGTPYYSRDAVGPDSSLSPVLPLDASPTRPAPPAGPTTLVTRSSGNYPGEHLQDLEHRERETSGMKPISTSDFQASVLEAIKAVMQGVRSVQSLALSPMMLSAWNNNLDIRDKVHLRTVTIVKELRDIQEMVLNNTATSETVTKAVKPTSMVPMVYSDSKNARREQLASDLVKISRRKKMEAAQQPKKENIEAVVELDKKKKATGDYQPPTSSYSPDKTIVPSQFTEPLAPSWAPMFKVSGKETQATSVKKAKTTNEKAASRRVPKFSSLTMNISCTCKSGERNCHICTGLIEHSHTCSGCPRCRFSYGTAESNVTTSNKINTPGSSFIESASFNKKPQSVSTSDDAATIPSSSSTELLDHTSKDIAVSEAPIETIASSNSKPKLQATAEDDPHSEEEEEDFVMVDAVSTRDKKKKKKRKVEEQKSGDSASLCSSPSDKPSGISPIPRRRPAPKKAKFFGEQCVKTILHKYEGVGLNEDFH